MTERKTESDLPETFPNTRWSVVIAARKETSAESAAALETLCRAYWYPLYAYVRRCGQAPHEAQDLTQEFFCRLLEKRWLDTADKEKGRLRTFLIVAMKRFMAKEWRRASTQRRGGGQSHLSIDTDFAESRYAADVTIGVPAEDVFDREWALALLDLTFERLRKEFTEAGTSATYEALKGSLMAAHGEIDYASVSRKLGTSEGAARVAVHRLRKRFREVYREELAQTLSKEADVEAELRHLALAISAAS